jgi:hypothetical protein
LAQIHQDRVRTESLISILQLMHNVITYLGTENIKMEED